MKYCFIYSSSYNICQFREFWEYLESLSFNRQELPQFILPRQRQQLYPVQICKSNWTCKNWDTKMKNWALRCFSQSFVIAFSLGMLYNCNATVIKYFRSFSRIVKLHSLEKSKWQWQLEQPWHNNSFLSILEAKQKWEVVLKRYGHSCMV